MSWSTLLYNKKVQYWIAQIFGWAAYYVLVYFSQSTLQESENLVPFLVTIYIASILLTHLLRFVIIRFNWFRFKPVHVLWRVVIACLLLAFVDEWYDNIMFDLIIEEEFHSELSNRAFLLNVIIASIFLFMWSALYFAFHYIGKSRAEEIKNIQLEASKTEIELKNLKAQLNPHFMFNSMNSIRALVDENPVQAKFAITQLSSILRNTLLMGKSKIVPIKDELAVVKDYLSLEAIRYEERLKVNYNIDEHLLDCEIPPMMMQTLVENAIKHGISKLPDGGDLDITIQENTDKIEVSIVNSGYIQSENPETGIGLRNTIKRLDLLYGADSEFNIRSGAGKVTTRFIYPKKDMI